MYSNASLSQTKLTTCFKNITSIGCINLKKKKKIDKIDNPHY